jgi:replicative DNA helicase
MISAPELEKRVLAGLMRHPKVWGDIAHILDQNDFCNNDSQVNRSIFKIVKHALDKTEEIDEFIIIERLKEFKFPDAIDIGTYISSLTIIPISEEVLFTTIKDLKKITARREIYYSSKKIQEYVKKVDVETSYDDIVGGADKLYHDGLVSFEAVMTKPQLIFDKAEELIEGLGENPVGEFGLMGPHPRINEIYGSLLLPGNITVVVARSGKGKSSYSLDYCTKVSNKYDVITLHADNGEMSEEELIFRQMSAMTGLPTYLFQSGKWRTASYGDMTNEEVVELTRKTFKKIKNLKFYYMNVAGWNADKITSSLKQFYYSKVGRGNQMIFSFDYIKSDFSNLSKGQDWLNVAKMVDKFKQVIHREICFDGKPCVSMFTSVQANRAGISTNKSSEHINDDESVVSLSDSITQFCSHLFLLREKTRDEIFSENGKFGTHKLIPLKTRHLGQNPTRAIHLVDMPDGTKRSNYINLEFKSFHVSEKGDLQDVVDALEGQGVSPKIEDDGDDIPKNLR